MSSSNKQAIWQEHIEKAKRHSGGVSGYCQEAGINASGFYQWRKKLAGPRKKSKGNSFVPAIVSPIERAQELPPRFEAQWVGQMLASFVRSLS